MSANPKVSVVITCYNYRKYVRQAIQSVLDQTYQDFEVLVVNDGSTDDSETVIQSFLPHPKIKYLPQKNGGQANAKNSGIKNAKGEFVAFLDADDFWEKTKLEKQLPFFDNPRTGVVYGRSICVNEIGQVLEHQPGRLALHRGRILEHFIFDNFVPFSTAIVRKSVFDDCGLFDESLAMAIDWDLWLRFSVKYEFDYTDEVLLFYRWNHPGQMSKNYGVREECSDRIFNKFLRDHGRHVPPELVRRAKIYTYNLRGYFFVRLDPPKAFRYYFRSLKEKWVQPSVFKGLLMAFIFYLLFILPGRTAVR